MSSMIPRCVATAACLLSLGPIASAAALPATAPAAAVGPADFGVILDWPAAGAQLKPLPGAKYVSASEAHATLTCIDADADDRGGALNFYPTGAYDRFGLSTDTSLAYVALRNDPDDNNNLHAAPGQYIELPAGTYFAQAIDSNCNGWFSGMAAAFSEPHAFTILPADPKPRTTAHTNRIGLLLGGSYTGGINPDGVTTTMHLQLSRKITLHRTSGRWYSASDRCGGRLTYQGRNGQAYRFRYGHTYGNIAANWLCEPGTLQVRPRDAGSLRVLYRGGGHGALAPLTGNGIFR